MSKRGRDGDEDDDEMDEAEKRRRIETADAMALARVEEDGVPLGDDEGEALPPELMVEIAERADPLTARALQQTSRTHAALADFWVGRTGGDLARTERALERVYRLTYRDPSTGKDTAMHALADGMRGMCEAALVDPGMAAIFVGANIGLDAIRLFLRCCFWRALVSMGTFLTQIQASGTAEYVTSAVNLFNEFARVGGADLDVPFPDLVRPNLVCDRYRATNGRGTLHRGPDVVLPIPDLMTALNSGLMTMAAMSTCVPRVTDVFAHHDTLYSALANDPTRFACLLPLDPFIGHRFHLVRVRYYTSRNIHHEDNTLTSRAAGTRIFSGTLADFLHRVRANSQAGQYSPDWPIVDSTEGGHVFLDLCMDAVQHTSTGFTLILQYETRDGQTRFDITRAYHRTSPRHLAITTRLGFVKLPPLGTDPMIPPTLPSVQLAALADIRRIQGQDIHPILRRPPAIGTGGAASWWGHGNLTQLLIVLAMPPETIRATFGLEDTMQYVRAALFNMIRRTTQRTPGHAATLSPTAGHLVLYSCHLCGAAATQIQADGGRPSCNEHA